MTAPAAPRSRDGVAWRAGLRAAAVAFAAVLVAELLSALAWRQGTRTGSLDRPVEEQLTIFLGSVVHNTPTAAGTSFGWQPGWLCLVAAVVTFLVVARPWRTFL